MIFSSLEYAIFFALTFAVYWAVPARFRWVVLLAASLVFYAFLKVWYLFVFLGLVVLISYAGGRVIDAAPEPPARRRALWGSIICLCVILIASKYARFFADAMGLPFLAMGPSDTVAQHQILVTIGLSYYTFTALSYVIDVSRRQVPAEKNLGYLALYLCFFPKLLQGPIERARGLLSQIQSPTSFDYESARSGLVLFTWGLLKKVVIADRLAPFVNVVYNDPRAYRGLPLIIAGYFYTFQLYADFSGYTDMALGSARLLNIKLTDNFRSPYFASSIADFWRRWHITLSTWLRDYIYIPLGGNRLGMTRQILNAMIVFFVCGLWHGASWTFVVWGLLHGAFVSLSILFRPLRQAGLRWLHAEESPITKALAVLVTFHLVAFAWIFFRAGSLSDAAYIVTHLLSGLGTTLSGLQDPEVMHTQLFVGQKRLEFLFALGFVLILLIVDSLTRGGRFEDLVVTKPAWFRWAGYYVMVLAVFIFGVFGSSQFLYFQF